MLHCIDELKVLDSCRYSGRRGCFAFVFTPGLEVEAKACLLYRISLCGMPCRSPCNRSINRLARLRSYRWSGLNEMFWRALRPQGTSEQRAQGKARPSSLRCVVDTETGTDTVTKLTHTLPAYSSLCVFAASEVARAVWRQGSAMSSTSTPTDRAAPQQRARRLPLPRSSTRAIRSCLQAAPTKSPAGAGASAVPILLNKSLWPCHPSDSHLRKRLSVL